MDGTVNEGKKSTKERSIDVLHNNEKTPQSHSTKEENQVAQGVGSSSDCNNLFSRSPRRLDAVVNNNNNNRADDVLVLVSSPPSAKRNMDLCESSPDYTTFFSSPQRAFYLQRQTQTLEERRLQKVQRNQDALRKLLHRDDSINDSSAIFNSEGQQEEKHGCDTDQINTKTAADHSRRRGMLGWHYDDNAIFPSEPFPQHPDDTAVSSVTATTTSQKLLVPLKGQLQELQEQFPFRTKQIQLLFHLLHSTILQQQQQDDEEFFLPPAPLFCVGCGGTGKTSIVKHILKIVALSSSSINVIPAFVDCGLLGNESHATTTNVNSSSSSVGALKSHILNSVWKDLLFDIYYAMQNESTTAATTNPQQEKTGFFQRNVTPISSNCLGNELAETSNPLLQLQHQQQHVDTDMIGNDDYDSEGELQEDEFVIQDENMIETQRKGSVRMESLETFSKALGRNLVEVSQTKENFRNHDGESNKKQQLLEETKRSGSLRGSTTRTRKGIGLPSLMQIPLLAESNLSRYSTGLPAAFAEALDPICGPTSNRKNLLVLVLDRAECLLGMLSCVSPNDRNDVLTQLLVLPQYYKLNMCIIVISSHGLLQHIRIHNTQKPTDFIGTLSEMINPIRVYFDNYQGNSMFETILQQSNVKRQIISGLSKFNSEDEALYHRAYKAMINMLVPSISSATRDLREMIRLCRLLWPEALQILKSQNDDGDIEWKNTFHVDLRPHIKQLIAHCLCQPGKSLPPMTSIQKNRVTTSRALQTTRDDSNGNQRNEYIRKFLLLSAFLCQQNRTDHDIALYTNRRREQGRRKKVRISPEAKEKKDDSRSRWCFSLERLFSVFSSLVGKYAAVANAQDYDKEVHDYVRSLGSSNLFAALAELRDLGLLFATGQEATLEMSLDSTAKQYFCRVSYSEAYKIADSVGFPLAQYLIADQQL